jgi:putative oxidoreductase
MATFEEHAEIRPSTSIGRILRDANTRTLAAAPIVLRITIGLVFIWFGVLKIAGESPAATLVEAALPFLAPSILVPTLGVIEVALGVTLLIGRWRRTVLLIMMAHLCGTFVTFLDAHSMMFQHNNPLLLTILGEFVAKNVVLISAALVLLGKDVREPLSAVRTSLPTTARSVSPSATP